MTVAKLATVAADANQVESQANQDAISLTTTTAGEHKVNVTAIAGADGSDGLYQFTSTDATQALKGDQEWLGFVLTLDEPVSTNITWNGTAFTAADVTAEVANADSVGETGGNKLVFWMPYSDIPRTITIGTANGSKNAVSISFVK